MTEDLVKRLREPYEQRQSRRVMEEFYAADRIEELEAKLAKAAGMMRSLAAMLQHAIGPGKDVFIEPDTGRKLSDAYAVIAEIEGESHE